MAASNKDIEKLKLESLKLRDARGNPLKISAKGSLGLLALGAKGVTLWRLYKESLKKD